MLLFFMQLMDESQSTIISQNVNNIHVTQLSYCSKCYCAHQFTDTQTIYHLITLIILRMHKYQLDLHIPVIASHQQQHDKVLGQVVGIGLA